MTALATHTRRRLRRTGRIEGNGILKGITSGLVGGLTASCVMEGFQSLLTRLSQQRQPRAGQEKKEEAKPATVVTADAISHALLRRDLTEREEPAAGRLVHYVFGTLLGGLYGGAAEVVPAVRAGGGAGYGAAVWLGNDELALWAVGLAKKPMAYPASTHVYALTSHLVYGMTLEGVRRVVRRML